MDTRAMTRVTIDLPEDLERKVRSRAAERGQEVADYLREVIERSVKTLDESLAPVRDGFARSGMSEEELDQFFEEMREQVWRERHPDRTRT